MKKITNVNEIKVRVFIDCLIALNILFHGDSTECHKGGN